MSRPLLLLHASIISFAILLRIMVGYHPHSGQDDYQGPGRDDDDDSSSSGGGRREKYGGDYEAQRHWMEITYHLPITEWYYHDLEYWGLDYPPLTAYHSRLFGWAAQAAAELVGGDYDEGRRRPRRRAEDEGRVEEASCDVVERRVEDSTACVDDADDPPLAALRDLVALRTSRWGYEDPVGKMYMRFTVLLSDVLVYFTAVWVLASRLATEEEEEEEEERDISADDAPVDDDAGLTSSKSPSSSSCGGRQLWILLAALCQPALILIDHGHFQYNVVSLGLALWSFHYITIAIPPEEDGWSSSFDGPVLGSVFFSLALNFKQMELYHAPAVFAYLLGRCFRHDAGTRGIFARTWGRFLALGMTVILTFAILWLPFAIFPRNDAVGFDFDGVMQILMRLFPFQRGIFEGKVANIWCAMSVRPFSIRDRIPPKALPLAALGLTLALILPPCWMLFRVGRGDLLFDRSGAVDRNKSRLRSSRPLKPEGGSDDIRALLWGTASTSLAFFLASYQVHEKGILIPLAPISLLVVDAPRFVMLFSIMATWSLWPLLVIDRLTDAYVCCLVIFLCIDSMTRVASLEMPSYKEEVDIFSDAYITRYVPTFSWILMILLHLLDLLLSPPHHLPDLFPVLWSLVGCGFFCVAYLGTLWAMVKRTNPSKKQGKIQQKAKKNIPPIPLISILGVILLSCPRESEGFLPPSTYCQNNIRLHRHLKLRESIAQPDFITQDLLDRARLPLEWERRNAQEAKPVLNLSSRDSDTLSLAMGADQTKSLADDDVDFCSQGVDDWISGRLWQVTEQSLADMGILLRNETTQASKLTSRHVLTVAPQLLRLPTSQIVEAACYLLSYPHGANSTDVIEGDPSLLTYLADDLQYGLEEYLPNMMFLGNGTLAAQMIQTQLKLSPTFAFQLIRMGVEGGLEERSVSRALGNAGKASGKAIEGVVGEMGRSLKEWKRIKGGKGSLGG